MHRLRANNPNGFTLVESPAGFTFIESPAGFTLVELLVVISVVLILSGVLIAIINPKVQRDKAEDTIRLEVKGNTNYPGFRLKLSSLTRRKLGLLEL